MGVDIIGMPIYYGCDVYGADIAYDVLNLRKLESIFTEHDVKNVGKVKVRENAEKYKCDKKIKYLEAVIESSNILYDKVTDTLNANRLPLIIGGDHCTAIGSISAVIDKYKDDVTVIYIDAHMDIHNDEDTPTGNIHGMPLSICMGRCNKKFNIGKYKLNPNNLIYFGIRNYEDEEMEYIKSNNISYYEFDYIKNVNIEVCLKELIYSIKTKYVHISFDVDSFDSNEFCATNVKKDSIYCSKGGLSINEGITCFTYLLSNLNVCSIDIVEYNPLLDDGTCADKLELILSTISKSLVNKNSLLLV